MKKTKLHAMMLWIFLIIFSWSAIHPTDRLVWSLEAGSLCLIIIFLIVTYRRFTFSTLSYILIFLCIMVLVIGSYYTFTEMPIFDLLQNYFGLGRNYYDRFAHFLFGFASAIALREVLIRKGIVQSRKWLFLIVVVLILGISAFYELIEWVAALVSGYNVIVGSQGDGYDTQGDMFIALVGSVLSSLMFQKVHDQILHRMLQKEKT